MEKRRKTLDRWHRGFVFGRRSVSNPPEDHLAAKTENRKAIGKTEQLKELTEMLKSNSRPSPPQMPPIPPPRKPRSPHNQSQESVSSVQSTKLIKDDSLGLSIDESEPIAECSRRLELPSNSNNRTVTQIINPPEPDLPEPQKIDNTPTVQPEDDLFTALPKVESRTIVGAYTQKNIPYRSASFSQIDYSSGKYIRSALGAIKASLKKNKELAVVDNANLTLPRKKDGSTSTSLKSTDEEPEGSIKEVDEDLFIPLRSELSINLKIESAIDLNEDVEDQQVSKCEIVHEEFEEVLAKSELLDGLQLVKASEMTLDTLSEELIIAATPPKEEFLQTATTCLIPVPVYECVVRDWSATETAPDDWINANDDDNAKLIEEYNVSLEKISELNENQQNIEHKVILEKVKDSLDDKKHKDSGYCCGDDVQALVELRETINITEELKKPLRNKFERSNTWSSELEHLPAISVTHGSSNESDGSSNLSEEVKDRLSSASEFVEVRKRHSNEDRPIESALTSSESLNSNSLNTNSEDRRRIDKSKRRKGIYFQWAVDKEKPLDSSDFNSPIEQADGVGIADGTRIDISNVDFSSFDVEQKFENLVAVNNVFLLCKTPDENNTPVSLEPTTPDSDTTRPPIWPKAPRRQSLSCQSSEEKDEPSASPSIKSFHKLNFLRSDSVSDNESDRTPPRERASQSPAPNDQDLKRYSKRPLRGPYGQMLEAEMKKPAKLHYDEILEELNRSER